MQHDPTQYVERIPHNVHFPGHTLVVLGDPHGQFTPIEDQQRTHEAVGRPMGQRAYARLM